MSCQLGELRSIYTENHDDYQHDGQDPYHTRDARHDSSRRAFLAHHNIGPELTREALLQALPPKPMSDGLIARFFDNDDPAIPVMCRYSSNGVHISADLVVDLLHRNTFLQEVSVPS